MTRSIRTWLAGAATGLVMVSGATAQELQKLKLGFGTKIVSPMIANILIPEYLGYYKEEGLTLEFFPLGPNTVVMEQIASKRIRTKEIIIIDLDITTRIFGLHAGEYLRHPLGR